MFNVVESATSFPELLHFTLNAYLRILRVKQGGIKYRFLSICYDLIWDWTPVFPGHWWTLEPLYIYIYIKREGEKWGRKREKKKEMNK